MAVGILTHDKRFKLMRWSVRSNDTVSREAASKCCKTLAWRIEGTLPVCAPLGSHLEYGRGLLAMRSAMRWR